MSYSYLHPNPRKCCLRRDAAIGQARSDSNNNAFEKDRNSKIAEFFCGRSVFITGASGFLGKVLIEKLLRCCTGVNSIYLLMRAKKGQTPKQRLETLLNSKVFERVRKEHGDDVFSKLMVVGGDICHSGLGIDSEDLNLLIRDVSVVFHSAATVKFDEPMRMAVDMNVLGTRRLVEMCHKLPLLEALVHVSTAYANCDRLEIDETIYPLSVTPQSVIDTIEWMDDTLLDSVTPALLGARPNTYTFTKALAENLLVDEAGGLPVAVVRPSIVTAAWKEPFPGWIDNVNGPTGLLTAISKGVVKSVVLDGKYDADFIPVDIAIDLMLAVAWHTATRKPNNLMVYNCTSGCINAMSWSLIRDHSLPMIYKYPSAHLYRCPGGSTKTNRLHHTLAVMYHHYLPAAAMDLVKWATGKKPKMVKLYHKIHKAFATLEYFTMNEWKFHCKNVLDLYEDMTPTDQKIFNFDIKELDWYLYFESYMLGIRQYILKEDNSTIPAARKNLQRMFLTNQLTNLALVLVLWKFVLLRSQTIRHISFFSIDALLRVYNALPINSIWSRMTS